MSNLRGDMAAVQLEGLTLNWTGLKWLRKPARGGGLAVYTYNSLTGARMLWWFLFTAHHTQRL